MRYLLVGYGNIGAKRKNLLGGRCVATVDPFNAKADHKSADEVSPDRYDAVILAVPNQVKLELLEKFLKLKKHVLVEKPLLFPDDATADRFEKLAQENGAIWYTSYNHRFEPQIAALKKHLDAGRLGTLYSARLFYGNGTVRNIVGSWRDGGLGVFEDLGCHLLDLAGWLINARGSKVAIREFRPIESKGCDRCILATEDQRIVMEASFISWKNTFTIDLFGEKGSLHVNGLCKWGPSELIVRERVFPSGVPKETREVIEGPDVTWERDLAHFETLVKEWTQTGANDAWISGVIATMAKPAAVKEETPTAFVGMSHLGLVSGIAWATFDRPVVLFDPDPSVIEPLKTGKLPIHEPGLAEALERHSKEITFTSDRAALKSCPIVVIARDVPTDADNKSSLKPIEEMFDAVLPHTPKGATLVHMCQVPPGFTRRLAERLHRSRPDVRVIYQVETLIFGNALERARKPERYMIGCSDSREPLPEVLERNLRRYGCPILPMRYESAELCKTAINLYLCGSVTYANTLSSLCETVGADWSEVVPALRLDKRIGPAAYIKPGLGIAGGNLERDLVTLRDGCRAGGVDASYIETIMAYNDRRYLWAVEMAERHIFAGRKHPTIAVWGLAYKKDTASTKNSRSLRVLQDLAGRAALRAYDPLVKTLDADRGVTICGRDEALQQAEGLLIMTEWDEFGKVEAGLFRRAMARPVVIDCVGILEGRRGDLEGVQYLSMGRGPGRTSA